MTWCLEETTCVFKHALPISVLSMGDGIVSLTCYCVMVGRMEKQFVDELLGNFYAHFAACNVPSLNYEKKTILVT
jgi:hypothetical protein